MPTKRDLEADRDQRRRTEAERLRKNNAEIRALQAENRAAARASASAKLRCFWSWPFRHVWEGRKCLNCPKAKPRDGRADMGGWH